jgi:hypothetical protein
MKQLKETNEECFRETIGSVWVKRIRGKRQTNYFVYAPKMYG